MQVNPTSNQPIVPYQPVGGNNVGGDGKQGTQPPVYDTSQNGGGNEEPAQIYQGKPPSGENVGTYWKLDDKGNSHYGGYFPANNGHPTVLKGQPPAGANVSTEWKLDDKGNSRYVGYTKLPDSEPRSRYAETKQDVFFRGFTDGATHPAQTFGKIADDQTGNKTHSGENEGKKIDGVLEKLPYTGEAMVITRGIAGQRNDDGTPNLPTPSVGVHADEILPAGKGGPPMNARPSKELAEAGKAPQVKAGAERESVANPPPAGSAPFGVSSEYAHAPHGNLTASPDSPGVYADDKGTHYVQADNQNWPVRYDKDNATWRVYNPDNGAKPQYPVQLDEHGNWQMHDNVGLKGGNPGEGGSSGNTLSNRDRLSQELDKSPTSNAPGSYPNSVTIVNDLLNRLNVNLSNQSADAIMTNLKKVDAGQMAHAGASAREAWTFSRDVADTTLPMKDRAAAALGTVLNGFAGPSYMAQFDLQNYHFGTNQSADLRQAMHLFAQFDPIG